MAAILALVSTACAQTAFEAIRQLPKDQAARIARVEGRDGTPNPDRWYILTHDPAAENGVHEFVVSNGEIVASRAVSQFAESLTGDDVLSAMPQIIDSDKAAKMAHDYAEANGAVVASMNYELKKVGPDAAPAWRVWCMDDKGSKVGEVVVTARDGSVVSHDGFALEPEPKAAVEKIPPKEPGIDTGPKPHAPEPVAATGADERPRHHHGNLETPPPKKPEGAISKTFDSVGRTLHKYLPF